MTASPHTLRHLILEATTLFAEAAVDSPRLSAEVLLAHCLRMDTNSLRKTLIVEPQMVIAPDALAHFKRLCQRRSQGTPVAYLTGTKEFFGLDFIVTPATLIPRPDTELLVELALATAQNFGNASDASAPLEINEKLLSHTGETGITTSPSLPPQSRQNSPFTFADLGTGSGCIAISLALHLPHWLGMAIDISPEALCVAQANARRHHAGSLQFIQSSFATLPFAPASLHMIVSNPPYISTEHYNELDHEVKDFEPQSALVPGSFITKSRAPQALGPEDFTPANSVPKEFLPKQFGPEKFTPADCTPADFTPKEFGPNTFVPDNFGLGDFGTGHFETGHFGPEEFSQDGSATQGFPLERGGHNDAATPQPTCHLASPHSYDDSLSTGGGSCGSCSEASASPCPARQRKSPLLANGLEDFTTIIEQAERLLVPQGFLLMEMGYDQGNSLSAHLKQRGWQAISVHKDLAGHDRVIKARWPGASGPSR